MYGRVKEREPSRTGVYMCLFAAEGERRKMEAERERERVKRKYVTLGWVLGLGDGEGASLFYFRLTRLCAPFLSVAPSLFHTLLFFLRCPHCSVSPPPFFLCYFPPRRASERAEDLTSSGKKDTKMSITIL